MLKQIILTFIAAITIANVQAQSDSDILMTVGDDKVTVGEFKYIYEKITVRLQIIARRA